MKNKKIHEESLEWAKGIVSQMPKMESKITYEEYLHSLDVVKHYEQQIFDEFLKGNKVKLNNKIKVDAFLDKLKGGNHLKTNYTVKEFSTPAQLKDIREGDYVTQSNKRTPIKGFVNKDLQGELFVFFNGGEKFINSIKHLCICYEWEIQRKS